MKRLLFIILTSLLAIAGQAQTETNYVFQSISNTTITDSQSGTWTSTVSSAATSNQLPAVWTATGASGRGVCFQSTATVTSAQSFTGVTRIAVECSSNNASNTIAVYVGETQVGSTTTITKDNHKSLEFENATPLNGAIKIVATRSGKSVWLGGVSVTTSSTGGGEQGGGETGGGETGGGEEGELCAYKTCLFGTGYNQEKVSSYGKSWKTQNAGFTWSISNFNNNNNGWSYVKCGTSSAASVGTITTSTAIDKAIERIDITIDAITVAKVNSIKVYTSTTNDFSSPRETITVAKAQGVQSATITLPAENLFYKIEFDCAKGSSNGLVTVSKVEYRARSTGEVDPPSPPTPTVPDAPTFSLASGTYEGAQTVEITAGTGCSIYYTTDGNDPTVASTLYTGALTISATTTLKAIAVNGELSSTVAEATYTIDPVVESIYRFRRVESVDDIVSGGTYILGCKNKGVIMNPNVAGGKCGSKVKAIGTDFTFGQSSYTRACEVTIDKVGDYYTMRNAQGNYLGHEESSSEGITDFASPVNNPTGEAYHLKISITSSKNVSISSTANTSRTISLADNGTFNFANGGNSIQLYMLDYPAPQPTITPEAGEYDEAQTVSIETLPGYDLYYTTDGTQPTTESTAYEGPFLIYEDVTVKAVAVQHVNQLNVSSVATASYTFVGEIQVPRTVTIWSEDWTGKDGTPSSIDSRYSQSSINTKTYDAKLAGGTAPELLLAKSGGTWTVNLTDLKGYTGGELTLSYRTNKNSLNVTINGEALEGAITTSGITTQTVTLASASTLSIIFTTTSNDNVRLDDLALTYFGIPSSGGGGEDPQEPVDETGWLCDHITYETIKEQKCFLNTDVGYTLFQNAQYESDADYDGEINFHGTTNSLNKIQVRGLDEGSAIYSSSTGGYIRKIELDWNSETTDGRSVDVYFSYDDAFPSLTETGDITPVNFVKGAGTSYYTPAVDGRYPKYVLITSNTMVVYFNHINIYWQPRLDAEIEPPFFSLPDGSTVYGATAVTVNCGTRGAEIYYAIVPDRDSEPTDADWRQYDGTPIKVTGQRTIKAKATKDGRESVVRTVQYNHCYLDDIDPNGNCVALVAEYQGKYWAITNTYGSSSMKVREVKVDGDVVTTASYGDIYWTPTLNTDDGTYCFTDLAGKYLTKKTGDKTGMAPLSDAAQATSKWILEDGYLKCTSTGSTERYPMYRESYGVRNYKYNTNTTEENGYSTKFRIYQMPDYKRTVIGDKWGTICLPKDVKHLGDTKFYEISHKNAEGTVLYLRLVDELEAGLPYFFRPVDNDNDYMTLGLAYEDGTAVTTAGHKNGLYGTLERYYWSTLNKGGYKTFESLPGYTAEASVYMLYVGTTAGELLKAAAGSWINQNRAYMVLSEVPIATAETDADMQQNSRRYVSFGIPGGGTATGVTTATGVSGGGHDAYDLSGRRVQMGGKGLFIINGRKVVK